MALYRVVREGSIRMWDNLLPIVILWVLFGFVFVYLFSRFMRIQKKRWEGLTKDENI